MESFGNAEHCFDSAAQGALALAHQGTLDIDSCDGVTTFRLLLARHPDGRGPLPASRGVQ